MKILFYSVLAVGLLCGCAANKSVSVQPDYSGAPAKIAAKMYPWHLPQPVCVRFRDARSDDVSHFKKLTAASARTWLGRAASSLADQDVSFVDDRGQNSALVTLHRAYVKHMGTSISAVVVLEISNVGYSKYYRGQAVRINWWGAVGEYELLLDRALADAFIDISTDAMAAETFANSHCK